MTILCNWDSRSRKTINLCAGLPFCTIVNKIILLELFRVRMANHCVDYETHNVKRFNLFKYVRRSFIALPPYFLLFLIKKLRAFIECTYLLKFSELVIKCGYLLSFFFITMALKVLVGNIRLFRSLMENVKRILWCYFLIIDSTKFISEELLRFMLTKYDTWLN